MAVQPTKVFHPTKEQFADPAEYIRSISAEGSQYGIVIVRPPQGWNPPSRWPAMRENKADYRTELTVQNLCRLRDGDDYDHGRKVTPLQYKQMADTFKRLRYPQFPLPITDAANHARKRTRTSKDDASTALKPGTSTGTMTSPTEDEYPLRGANDSIEQYASAIEAEYWKIVERGQNHDGDDVVVYYANDQDTRKSGSGFLTRACPSPFHTDNRDWTPPPSVVQPVFEDEQYYAQTGWNITNLPFIRGSLLRFVSEEVNGVNVPWLYFGSIFATFCWHNEDNHAYSINYMHEGQGKIWYGVPDRGTAAFESYVQGLRAAKLGAGSSGPSAVSVSSTGAAAARSSSAAGASLTAGDSATGGDSSTPLRTKRVGMSDPSKDPLYTITMMVNPASLVAHGVPVFRAVQCPGDYVVTFPQAYHAGFSLGWNMAEAVNFALSDWLPWGYAAVQRYADTGRGVCRPPAFSHEQLLLAMSKPCSASKAVERGEPLTPTSSGSVEQGLQDVDDGALPLLYKQLKALVQAERQARQALLDKCAAARCSPPDMVRISSDSDERLECLACKRVCHVSAVLCRGCAVSNKRVTCILHADSAKLCKCPLSKKTLAYYYSPGDLEVRIAAVEAEAVLRGVCVMTSHGAPKPALVKEGAASQKTGHNTLRLKLKHTTPSR